MQAMVPAVFIWPHQGRTQRCCFRGALKAEVLNRAAKAAFSPRGGGGGESMRGGINPLSLGGGVSGGSSPENFSQVAQRARIAHLRTSKYF